MEAPKERTLRASKYPMMDFDKAISLLEGISIEPKVETLRLSAEIVGRVLAQDVMSRVNIPPFRASVVDGYAVRLQAEPKKLPLIASSRAGASPDVELPEGKAMYVTTGGPVPHGAEACVKIEDTKGFHDASGKEMEVQIPAVTSKGAWIREIGCDVAKGSVVMEKGRSITPSELGILASVGVQEVQVFKAPKVGVLSSGDELLDPVAGFNGVSESEFTSKIIDSNRLMLLSAVAQLGAEAVDLGIARDEKESLRKVLRNVANTCDVVITTGGVSMGDHDFIKPLLEELGTVLFGRVKLKPGKPTTLATVPRDTEGSCVFFGLPGNPVSGMVTFHLFVAKMLKRMMGVQGPEAGYPEISVTLNSPIKLDPERPEFHRVFLTVDGSSVKATSTGKQASSRLLSMKAANGLLKVPQGEGSLSPGATLTAIVLGPLLSTHLPVDTSGTPSSGCGHHHGHGHSHGHSHSHSHGHGHSHSSSHHGGSSEHKSEIKVRVGVLTVSDSISAGKGTDSSGPLAVDLCKSLPGWSVEEVQTALVADDKEAIQQQLRKWSDDDGSALDVVFTTGGTGFGPRDVTPEATRPLLDRPAPGLVHAMYVEGMKNIATSILSRAEAGSRKRTLIINLPGSRGGVKDGIRSLSAVLPHAVNLLRGNTSH